MLIIFFKVLVFQVSLSLIMIYFSKKLGLLDIPNERKTHLFPVPYTGGIILSVIFLFLIFVTDFDGKYLNLLLSYAFLIALTGYIDDRYKVNPGTKIALQIIPIFLLINNGLYLKNIGEYEFFGNLNLGSFDKIFTLLCCLLIINAANYSDGTDGLLSVISIIIISSYAYFLINVDKYEHAYYLLLISFTLTIHSLFNFGFIKKFKIFLGDSGSNLLGFIISFITINLYVSENIHPSLLIWPLSYIVFEFLSVNIIRIIDKRAIFGAGSDHLHYQIISYFKINNFLMILLISIKILFFIIVGIFLNKYFSPDFSLIFYFLLFIIYLFLRINFHHKVEAKKKLISNKD